MGKILTVTLNPCIDKTIMLDGFNYGGLNRVGSVRTDAGGKGINAAKVLKSFGADVLCYTLASGDGKEYIRNYLNEKGMPTIFGEVQGEVRTNLKIVDLSKNITTEINEKGFTLSEDESKNVMAEIVSYLTEIDILVLGGSLPMGMNEDVYAKLVKTAKEKGVKVILDADGDRLRQGIEEIPYAIKPNISEFEELCGEKLDSIEKIVSKAREIVNKGIELVIVSMGADGAVFVSKDESYKTFPLDIECKSTVGAGDSMVAVLAFAIDNELSLGEISRLCTCAGSITCSKEGAQVCSVDEVMANKDKINSTRLG